MCRFGRFRADTRSWLTGFPSAVGYSRVVIRELPGSAVRHFAKSLLGRVVIRDVIREVDRAPSTLVNAPFELGISNVVVLTVEEAGRVLRIGRSLAYELAARYEASGGVDGLPVIRVAGCLRVPKWALLELAMTGRVVRLCDAHVSDAIAPAAADEVSGAR